MIDIDTVRADIPALENLIHFNNAGTSLMAKPVYRSLIDYLDREQAIGGYEAAEERAADTNNFYVQAARLINASPEEIAFTQGASMAWQLFFYSLKLERGDQVITTQLDYGSNFVGFLHQRERLGIEIVVIDTDEHGEINPGDVAAAITDRTRLISLSHIPTANGIINPAAAIGALAQQHEIPFLLDACQSAGQIDVDVKAIGCAALSTAGRKYLRGPRGTGFLYVASDFLKTLDPVMLEQHGVELQSRDSYRILDSATRFENFEVSFAGRIGLGKALEYANELGPKNIDERIRHLGRYCRERLDSVDGVTVADEGRERGGIVMFDVAGANPPAIRDQLRQHGIQVWASAGPGSLVDFQDRSINCLVRASLHYFNTEAEIDRMIEILSR